jgi:hypothetical protein
MSLSQLIRRNLASIRREISARRTKEIENTAVQTFPFYMGALAATATDSEYVFPKYLQMNEKFCCDDFAFICPRCHKNVMLLIFDDEDEDDEANSPSGSSVGEASGSTSSTKWSDCESSSSSESTNDVSSSNDDSRDNSSVFEGDSDYSDSRKEDETDDEYIHRLLDFQRQHYMTEDGCHIQYDDCNFVHTKKSKCPYYSAPSPRDIKNDVLELLFLCLKYQKDPVVISQKCLKCGKKEIFESSVPKRTFIHKTATGTQFITCYREDSVTDYITFYVYDQNEVAPSVLADHWSSPVRESDCLRSNKRGNRRRKKPVVKLFANKQHLFVDGLEFQKSINFPLITKQIMIPTLTHCATCRKIWNNPCKQRDAPMPTVKTTLLPSSTEATELTLPVNRRAAFSGCATNLTAWTPSWHEKLPSMQSNEGALPNL